MIRQFLCAVRESAQACCALMTPASIEFEPLTEADLPLLHYWLNRPHVLEWWTGESSLEEVRAKYLPRIGSDSVRRYLAYLNAEPIGYMQSYLAVETEDGWWAGNTDPGVLGIDQFIADPARLGQGLGAMMVARFAALLFSDPAVSRIQVSAGSAPDNVRAIRCYEKAGFRRRGMVITPDGPAAHDWTDRRSHSHDVLAPA